MPKSRKQQKEPEAPTRPYAITGGPSMGYTICLRGTPLLVHFAKMWEAIGLRDDLNTGRLKIDEERALQHAKSGPVAVAS